MMPQKALLSIADDWDEVQVPHMWQFDGYGGPVNVANVELFLENLGVDEFISDDDHHNFLGN